MGLGGLIAAGAALWAGIAHFTPHGAPSAVAYSPAAYASQIDDHFTTGDLSSYTPIRSVVAAILREAAAPVWSVGSGQASATAAQPWYGALISSAAATTPQATALVDVKALDSGPSTTTAASSLALSRTRPTKSWSGITAITTRRVWRWC